MEKKSSKSHESDVRKGPWTMEEDMILINYIANHGEGVWNTLARSAGDKRYGLKRTGKSCRLRWLNYLRPDVRRGNITPEEQFLIMDLHARWGNRWSKIARQLPGRTDNEIKNFWRTRIQKQMKNTEPVPAFGINNFASTSCPSSGEDDQIEPPSPPMHIGPQVNNAGLDFAPPPPSEDVFWGMEDLWSLQLFNGE
ncbi:hypothetical protein QJS10_CPB12g00175 [Acorus calamus]|uniref:Uncharacterized protein n=1 Tax=Acorus calamus TaxID=4465 RepID=A0AAV9DP22_ACOCL|nr:hypothetical protein QJS10_CPB12g00175 [Acorus calamus]